MALILNIETATSVCSAVISRNGKVISLKESEQANVHAEKLTVFIQNALEKASVKLNELNAVAVGSGPGSYTGLRIGTSVAKGLCYALDIPLISVPTLKAMADAASQSIKNSELKIKHSILFCPMIDARRLEVYTALYDGEGNEVLPVHARILDSNTFTEYLDNHTITFFGDGMPKMKNLFPEAKNILWIDDITTSAKNMATLSEDAYNSGKFSDLAYYEPFYLKDFVAKKKIS